MALNSPDGLLFRAHRNLLHRPITFRAISRYDGSAPTNDAYIQLQERRLDDARRPSVRIHSKQTSDAQHGLSNLSSAGPAFISNTL